MPQPKATLEEMAAECQEEADHVRGILAFHAKHYPLTPPDTHRQRKAHVLENAAHVLRIMATFEDKSRKFIGELLTEHSRE